MTGPEFQSQLSQSLLNPSGLPAQHGRQELAPVEAFSRPVTPLQPPIETRPFVREGRTITTESMEETFALDGLRSDHEPTQMVGWLGSSTYFYQTEDEAIQVAKELKDQNFPEH